MRKSSGRGAKASRAKTSRAKTPRFFCENCGVEVPKDAKECPGCGRFFASVRCPACGFEGGEAVFNDGCPACGYSSGASRGRSSGFPGGDPFRGGREPDFPERRKAAGPLSFWIYLLAAAVFTGVLAALFFTVF